MRVFTRLPARGPATSMMREKNVPNGCIYQKKAVPLQAECYVFNKNYFGMKTIFIIQDDEAIRLVKSMPKWLPALLNGEPIAKKTTLPLGFGVK